MVDEIKRPPAVAERARIQIESAIFSGELKIGEALKESHLMREMKVSRGTVRQASNVLHDRGLVDVVPCRNVSVADLDHYDVIQKNYTTRALIELCGALVAFKASWLNPTLLDDPRAKLDEMREAEEPGDLEGITLHDVELHLSLIGASRHAALVRSFRTWRRELGCGAGSQKMVSSDCSVRNNEVQARKRMGR